MNEVLYLFIAVIDLQQARYLREEFSCPGELTFHLVSDTFTGEFSYTIFNTELIREHTVFLSLYRGHPFSLIHPQRQILFAVAQLCRSPGANLDSLWSLRPTPLAVNEVLRTSTVSKITRMGYTKVPLLKQFSVSEDAIFWRDAPVSSRCILGVSRSELESMQSLMLGTRTLPSSFAVSLNSYSKSPPSWLREDVDRPLLFGGSSRTGLYFHHITPWNIFPNILVDIVVGVLHTQVVTAYF